MNIPRSTIRSIRRKNGQDRSTIFCPSKEEFANKFNELKDVYKVAEYYGADRHTVSKYANSIGIKTTKLVDITEKDKEYIISQYNCVTAKELAKKYNVSQSYISKLWMDNGLKGKEKRIYHINQSVLDNIDTELKAYFLGFFAADGCLYKPSKYEEGKKQIILRVCIHEQDEYILNYFKELFDTDKPITKVKNYVALEISSNKLGEKIIEYGLEERKTYGNTICDLDDDMMRHFIRGYFDGDGSITKNKDAVNIVGYKDNMEKLKGFLENKNIYMNILVDDRKNRPYNGGVFTILYSTNKTNRYAFLKYIYKDANYFLIRKKNLADEYINQIESSNNIRDKEIVNYYNYAVLDK